MKKRLSVFLLCILCLLYMTVFVHAAPTLVVDEAGLLSTDEVQAISTMASELKSTYDLNVVIITLESTNGQSPRYYAETYYEANYHMQDGILLLVSMEERDWYICTTGKAQKIFSDEVIDYLSDSFVDALSQGNYAHSFERFLSEIPHICDAYDQGKSVSNTIGYTHVIIALLTGIAIGGIAIALMRHSMNSARPQPSAAEYVVGNSFRLNVIHDLYLYSRVSKTPRQNNSSGSHSGGGGGGRSHGGGGGKF